MSKEFTIPNQRTFDGVKYMENGDLCSDVCPDCTENKYRSRSGRALPTVPSLYVRQRRADGYAS